MTTAPTVAVVATSLAQTDRRALSQAWYSALHLADHSGGKAALRAHAAASPGRRSTGAAFSPARTVSAPSGGARALARPTARGGAPALPVLDRRTPATPLAKRIERALAHRAPHAPAATLAIKAAGGRVQVIVREERGATRIVALCAPALRERVEQALAHARFALAAQGSEVRA